MTFDAAFVKAARAVPVFHAYPQRPTWPRATGHSSTCTYTLTFTYTSSGGSTDILPGASGEDPYTLRFFLARSST